MSSPPDMDITVYDKERATGAKVGVGWSQPDGTINLVLNPGCALIYGANLSYKVKPKEKPSGPSAPAKVGFVVPKTRLPRSSSGFDDNDIPF